MPSIYSKIDNDAVSARINQLTPETKTLWGKMTQEDWDELMWKHLDHHLRQFGV
jgi:hypothetical protein